MKTLKLIFSFFIIALSTIDFAVGQESELVYLDKNGIMKWADSNQEVALFGANYCLPSACDYRAAKYFTNDLKSEVVKDMSHFVRMGWDGLRVCFWGDFQNTDTAGNLVNNEHLDLMDYLIYQADKRGIKMLLSPIVTYSSQWPDAMNEPATGFSTYFDKSELGSNPQAIKAQQNYLRQLLNHVNPYTGRAIKNEPNILFVEMINEPWHHSDDLQGSIDYINALADAVRSTGCNKVLFHNVSQDFNISEAIQKSNVQGASFAWYPSGLNSGRTLAGNYLRTVDRYDLMLKPELDGLARIVYEFDQPDLLTPYMYPAMVRTFRSVGAQFAAIFSYDMLVSAHANLGWQTHYINMVHTPQKAVGAMIAAQAMHTLPLYKDYGSYPGNTSFGDFRISHKEWLSEYVSEEVFMNAGNTKTSPKKPEKLKRIVGYGSSPVVKYDGSGAYFLDRMAKGVWRLEVYPDVEFVDDPFEMMSPDKTVSRALFKEHPMEINLLDLGKEFTITGENLGNSLKASTFIGRVDVSPGVYTLSKRGFAPVRLPDAIQGGIPYKQFIVPAPVNAPLSVIHKPIDKVYSSNEISLSARIIDEESIDSVKLFIRPKGSWFRSYDMVQKGSYEFTSSLPGDFVQPGYYDYAITVYQGNGCKTFPSGLNKSPYDWNFSGDQFWSMEVLPDSSPYCLFSPKDDISYLSFTRIGDAIRQGIFNLLPTSEDPRGAIVLQLPTDKDPDLKDYTFSLFIGDRIRQIKGRVPNELVINGRGSVAAITLIEIDGTSWSKEVRFHSEWSCQKISLMELRTGEGVMLPQGYPGNWNYWLSAPDLEKPSRTINIDNVETIQISVRPEITGQGKVEVGAIEIY